jgi:Flp pilus assembly protein TadB
MAIDGRQIGRPPEEKDLSQSAGVRIAAVMLVVVPAVAVVVLAYLVGTWTGGVVGGVLSVLSTLLTIAVLWILQRRRRR